MRSTSFWRCLTPTGGGPGTNTGERGREEIEKRQVEERLFKKDEAHFLHFYTIYAHFKMLFGEQQKEAKNGHSHYHFSFIHLSPSTNT